MPGTGKQLSLSSSSLKGLAGSEGAGSDFELVYRWDNCRSALQLTFFQAGFTTRQENFFGPAEMIEERGREEGEGEGRTITTIVR